MPIWRTSKSNRARAAGSTEDLEDGKPKRERWTMGIMNDKETDEVPGAFECVGVALGLLWGCLTAGMSSLLTVYSTHRLHSITIQSLRSQRTAGPAKCASKNLRLVSPITLLSTRTAYIRTVAVSTINHPGEEANSRRQDHPRPTA